jgi:hypothetical protein
MDLVDQHQHNTQKQIETVVGDSKHGTTENFATCVGRNLAPHLGVLADKQKQHSACEHCFELEQFQYDATSDSYQCPSRERLTRQRYHERPRTWEYRTEKGVCAGCALRAQCTTRQERTLQRHQEAALVELGRKMARTQAARRDCRRRWHLMEGSFGRAAQEHGFKRARWRQQIQDYLIVAIQNIRILVARSAPEPAASNVVALREWICASRALNNLIQSVLQTLPSTSRLFRGSLFAMGS